MPKVNDGSEERCAEPGPVFFTTRLMHEIGVPAGQEWKSSAALHCETHAMTPVEQFDRTVERANAIVELHQRTYAKKGRPPQEWSDVLRGALMLVVAALDALVDDLLVDRLPVAITRGVQGPTVDGWVKSDPKRALQALADPNQLEFLTTWVKEVHSKDSFVQPWVIEAALRDELGCPIGVGGASEPWDGMAARLALLGVTWTPNDCRSTLERIVRRRNDIAHDGDVDQTGRTQSIRRDHVAVAVLAISCAGRSINAVVHGHIP